MERGESMTPRERVAAVLMHKAPDRVPVDIGGTACGLTNPTLKRVKEYYGISDQNDILHRPDESASYNNDDVLEALGGDFRQVFIMPPENHDFIIDDQGRMIGEWGIAKKFIHGLAQNASNPLIDADISDMESFAWPNPLDLGRKKGVRARAEHLYNNTDYALTARSVSHGIFELAWELRSMENFMCDMLIDKPFANKLLNKILDIQIGMYDALLSECGEYVQIVQTADDYGSQRGLLMSPELFKEMILPRRKELNAFIKSKAPNAKIQHHTCGSVFALIDLIIETGVDILNPIQTLAADMQPERLKCTFGDRIIFHGAIDEQSVLVGPIEELEAAMKNRVETLGRGGGYIMAPTSNFQDDMPLENIINFADLAHHVCRSIG